MHVAAGKNDLGGQTEEEGSSMIQHKANPYPVVEALDDSELRTTIQRTQLIVVASLIDKQANLGGKSRPRSHPARDIRFQAFVEPVKSSV